MTATAPEAPRSSPSGPRIVPAARKLGEALLFLVFDGYFTTHVSGREHVPDEGVGTVIAANHVSSLDVFAAGHAVKRPGFFLAKREATEIPGFGPFLKALGAIPAQRDGRDMQAVKDMLKVLQAGHMLGVAPEGTRSSDGRLQAFDPGFAWLAARTGAVVVPCAIHNTWALMPKNAPAPKPGPLWVRFGPGRTVGDRRPDAAAMADFAATIRQDILDMLTDLVAETGRPNPAVNPGTANEPTESEID